MRQAGYVLELQHHPQRNYRDGRDFQRRGRGHIQFGRATRHSSRGAGNVALAGSAIEAFSDMAPGVAPAVRQPNRAAAPRGYAPGEGTTANPL